MIGRQVRHRTFSVGSIIGYEAGKITVDFSGTIRLFQFPESFERFLTADDDILREIVAAAIKENAKAREKAEEERRVAKEAEEAAAKKRSNLFPGFHSPNRGDPIPLRDRRIATMSASPSNAISAMVAPAVPVLDSMESALIG